ncbi:CHRD domain-containing protein [Glaciimonas sp. PCH181]|nr:CHRD domain-containing protein [Glaciimonas sp. PCH181]
MTLVITGCASTASAPPAPKATMGMMGMMGHSMQAKLDGAHEVPANDSTASGITNITVAADKSVSGNVTTTGIDGKAAHIHIGAAGVNGPVIVPLSKTGDNVWSVPAGAMLTDPQYASYLAGNLYVNVHSAAHPGGEIRVQLTK